jgi:large subunit ribosomal protein L4
MKAVVKNWAFDSVGEVDLSAFSVPVRRDIVARVVHWQLAKRRSGNHKTKGISDISGTTRKPFKQKGTGRARQGSLRSPQFRGGAVIFGPVVRSHAYSLPKKIRRLGLKCAISAKMEENALSVLEAISLDSFKTADFLKKIAGLGDVMSVKSVLMVDGPEVCPNLKKAISNLGFVNVLPQHALNVYDILRHRHLILSSASVDYLKEFLK